MIRKIVTKAALAKAKAETYLATKMAGVKEENGDHLLEVLGTIIIAVVILIFFRQEIINLFQSAVNNTTTSVNGLFNNVTNTPVNPGP